METENKNKKTNKTENSKAETSENQKEKKKKVNQVLALIQVAKVASRNLWGSEKRRIKESEKKIDKKKEEEINKIYSSQVLLDEDKTRKINEVEAKAKKNKARIDKIKQNTASNLEKRAYSSYEKVTTNITNELNKVDDEQKIETLKSSLKDTRAKLDQRLNEAQDKRKKSKDSNNEYVKNKVKEKLNSIKKGVAEDLKEKKDYLKQKAKDLLNSRKEIKLKTKLTQIKTERAVKKGVKETGKALKKGVKGTEKIIKQGYDTTVEAIQDTTANVIAGTIIAGTAVVDATKSGIESGKKLGNKVIDIGEDSLLNVAEGALDIPEKIASSLAKTREGVKALKESKKNKKPETSSEGIEVVPEGEKKEILKNFTNLEFRNDLNDNNLNQNRSLINIIDEKINSKKLSNEERVNLEKEKDVLTYLENQYIRFGSQSNKHDFQKTFNDLYKNYDNTSESIKDFLNTQKLTIEDQINALENIINENALNESLDELSVKKIKLNNLRKTLGVVVGELIDLKNIYN
jgi:hypothetical protein